MIWQAVQAGFGYFQREAGYTRTGSHGRWVHGREPGQRHEADLAVAAPRGLTLDHLPELIALVRGKRASSMTPALLIRTLAPPSSLCTGSAAATSVSRLVTSASNGNRFVVKLSCEGLDPVGPAGEQCEPVPACGQGAGCRRADS